MRCGGIFRDCFITFTAKSEGKRSLKSSQRLVKGVLLTAFLTHGYITLQHTVTEVKAVKIHLVRVNVRTSVV